MSLPSLPASFLPLLTLRHQRIELSQHFLIRLVHAHIIVLVQIGEVRPSKVGGEGACGDQGGGGRAFALPGNYGRKKRGDRRGAK